jgi:hypothetical protein
MVTVPWIKISHPLDLYLLALAKGVLRIGIYLYDDMDIQAIFPE